MLEIYILYVRVFHYRTGALGTPRKAQKRNYLDYGYKPDVVHSQ